eukprot:s444_g20.t2
MPLQLQGARTVARIRVSVVGQQIPLLLSKSDLKKLGMVMDLDRGLVNFRGLDIQVPLRETKTGLCGFQINVMVTDLRQGSQGGPEHVRATRINVVKCEDIAQKLYHDCDFNNEVLLDLVRLLPIRVSKRHRDINGGGQPANEAWVAGFYAHGGWTGVTRRTTRYPQVVRFLNAFMRHHVGDEGESWTSLTLMKNVSTDIHVDCHNQKESSSTTLNFGEFSGGQLWIADDSVDATACVWKKDKDGNRLKGRLHDTYRRPTRFDPHAPHATHTWQGERWCLSVYSVRTAVQVSDEIRKALQKLKFPFRKTAASRTLGNEQSVTFMSSNHQEPPQSADDMGDDDEHSGIASPIKLRSQTCSPDGSGLGSLGGRPAVHSVPHSNAGAGESSDSRRFPSCRVTLPAEYDGRPTKEIQAELEASEKTKEKEKEKDQKFLPPRRSRPRKATTGAGASSDGSWVRTGAVPFDEDDVSETEEINPKEVNTKLTKEEAEMILQMRVKKKAEGKGKGLTENLGK